ncbi:MAG: hypothetical protein NT034_02510, partial [Candidatus Magasanikbacteria bacterium]|nr:hypothetical protein [Candidatus Magasanikbacteria bacterium]
YFDDVSIQTLSESSAGPAFILNASNFSASSTSETLLSVRSNNTEKLNLTSGGNLSVYGDMDIGGSYKINGTNVSQYFITSAGSAGQLWQSDGVGAGQWVSTSSLGLGGASSSSSLPDGTSGQLLTYGASGWEASSTIQVSNLFTSNSALFANKIEINSSGVINSLSSGEAGTSSNLLTNSSFESSPATTSWENISLGGGSIMSATSGMGVPIYNGGQAMILQSGTYETTVGMGGIMQTFSNPAATTSLSFYATAQADWTAVGVVLVGDEECDVSSKYIYNIYDNVWECVFADPINFQFDGSYVKNFNLFADGYHQQTMDIAPYTHSGSIHLIFINGEEDGGDFGIYQGQTVALDQVTITSPEAAVPAFIFNTPNFSTSSDSATLLSIRSNDMEKLNLTSGGLLSVGGLSSYGTTTFYGNSFLATTTFSATVGIGTSASNSAQLEILSTAYDQLRLSYSADAYVTMGVGPAGNLIINPVSTADSSVYAQNFNGSFPPSGWTSGGNASWIQNNSVTQEGAGSAQNGDIGDSQSSWINLDVETSDGTVTFWRKVSSESGWDYLQFCYDMNETCDRTHGSVTAISGFVDWQEVSFPVTAGMHSFRWLYAKDSSASTGADSGYIDNISIPVPGGQETALFVNGGGRFSGHVLVGTSTAFVSSSNYMLQVDSGSSEGEGIAVNGQIIASSYITGSTTVDLAETYPVLEDCKLNNSCPESGDTVCSKLVSSTYYVEK